MNKRRAAMAVILEGIADWLMGECTVRAGIVEEVARMVEKCRDGEELRDLSVQLRDMAISFEPDASRVAMTSDEAMMLHLLEEVEGERYVQ